MYIWMYKICCKGSKLYLLAKHYQNIMCSFIQMYLILVLKIHDSEQGPLQYGLIRINSIGANEIATQHL